MDVARSHRLACVLEPIWSQGRPARVTVVVGGHFGVRPGMALEVGVSATFKEQHLSIQVACRLQLWSDCRGHQGCASLQLPRGSDRPRDRSVCSDEACLTTGLGGQSIPGCCQEQCGGLRRGLHRIHLSIHVACSCKGGEIAEDTRLQGRASGAWGECLCSCQGAVQ